MSMRRIAKCRIHLEEGDVSLAGAQGDVLLEESEQTLGQQVLEGGGVLAGVLGEGLQASAGLAEDTLNMKKRGDH